MPKVAVENPIFEEECRAERCDPQSANLRSFVQHSIGVTYFSSAESIIGSGTTILERKTGVQYNSELNKEEFPEADSNLGFRVL